MFTLFITFLFGFFDHDIVEMRNCVFFLIIFPVPSIIQIYRWHLEMSNGKWMGVWVNRWIEGWRGGYMDIWMDGWFG